MSITITMNKISYCILHIILYAELSWHHWPVLSWLNSLESIDHIDHVVHFLDWNECLGSHVATILVDAWKSVWRTECVWVKTNALNEVSSSCWFD